MTGTFIYGLWGSPEMAPRRAKILMEIERWLRTKYRPEPWEIYVYGQNNRDWLAYHGIASTMLHADPLVDFCKVGGPPSPRGHGQLVWDDCSIWRHKTELMSAAIAKHRTIVWLDFDTVLRQPLPDDFWERMAAGQPVQMSSLYYRRPYCFWRKRGHARRIMPEGAFIYCRSRRIIARVNRRYAKHRRLIDQEVFASVMDEMTGGWPGHKRYKALGFEPYCHHIYKQVHKPEVMLFETGGRIRQERWEDRYANRHKQAVAGGSPP